MGPNRARWVALVAACLGIGLGAAPATPSYQGINRLIQKVETDWKALTPEQNPHGAGWLQYFDKVRTELRQFSSSADPEQRVAALKRLYNLSNALRSSGWDQARKLHAELREWLRPRVALAWAEYRVLEALQGLPEAESEKRAKWQSYIDDVFRPSLHEFEAAATVINRLTARERLHAALQALQKNNQTRPWSRSLALQSAVADLYGVPNLEVTLDGTAVSAAVLPEGIVEPGWIYFNNQWSYVTPGPLMGIGFVPTADGIQVAISQALNSTTPIQGFQQQVAQDPQGSRAAKLYQFGATSQNNAVLTITVLFRLATGIQLAPGYQHGISAVVNSTPQPGKGLTRMIASLIGLNQNRITEKVYEGAIGKIQQQMVQGSRELAAIKASQKAADLNARVRPYVIDAQTAGSGDFGLADIQLGTGSQYARVLGTVVNLGAPDQQRANFPQPLGLSTIGSGVTVDIHLPSALSNLVHGFMTGAAAKDVNNVMIVTTKVPHDPKPPDVVVTRNADWATFSQQVEQARQTTDREVQAIRVFKPDQPLQVMADADGNLVLIAPDFTIDVPAPPAAARGGALTGPPARVYRIKAKQAEFAIAFELRPALGAEPPHIVGKVMGFDPGANVQVLAINEDEEQAVSLNALTARIIASAFGSKITGLPFDAPIDTLANAPVDLVSASPLDPTGWMRLVLRLR